MSAYEIRIAPRSSSQAIIMADRIVVGRGWREKEGWVWKLDSVVFEGAGDVIALGTAIKAWEERNAG